MDSARLVVTLLVIAFVIDRVAAALMFVGSYVKSTRGTDDESRLRRKEYRRKLVYFLISGTLAAVALALFPKARIPLTSADLPNALVTWLVLVAGADRISEFVGKSETPNLEKAGGKTEFRVTGTLKVDDETARRLETATGE